MEPLISAVLVSRVALLLYPLLRSGRAALSDLLMLLAERVLLLD